MTSEWASHSLTGRKMADGDHFSVFTVKGADGKPAVPVVIDLISLGLLKGMLPSVLWFFTVVLIRGFRLDAALCHGVDRVGFRDQG
jgi:hypothetical protein